MSAPRLPRRRLLDGLLWLAAGCVPSPAGAREADAEELATFAAAVLAPVAPDACGWCAGRGCPACGVDRERETHTKVLVLLRENGPMSGRALRGKVGGRGTAVVRAVHALQREGVIARQGTGRMTRWRVVAPDDRTEGPR